MKWIRQRALDGKLCAGTFLSLGSAITAEIAGNSGFEWLLLDLEHGSGDRQELLTQLQAVEATSAAPIVRLGSADPTTIKRTLDLGPSGLMIPFVSSAAEAEGVVRAMSYPPVGERGVASFNRACNFGQGFDEYFAKANDELLVVVQIETREALENLEEIAAVPRVDVLFVGPLDLSVSLGSPKAFDDAEFCAALERVVTVSRNAGKAPGILAPSPNLVPNFVALGFTFVACGSDGGAVASGLRSYADAVRAASGEA